MTDTPRTLAEVKALLADNSSRNISAQDMRDVIESIVDPVADGGFDRPGVAVERTITPQSIASGASLYTPVSFDRYLRTFSPSGSVPDPSGLWSVGDPQHVFLNRPGWWMVSAGCQWDANSTGIREAFASMLHYGFDPWADYRSATVGGVTEQYGSGLCYVQAGATDERVELEVNQTAGAPLNLYAFVQAYWLGP